MNINWDVIVVGGGVIGNAAAYYLQKSGRNVLLLEKGTVGQGASKAAAGMLGAQVELTEVGPMFELARESREMFPRLQEELKEMCGIDIELVREGMLKVAKTDEEKVHLQSVIEAQRSFGENTKWLDREETLKMESSLSDRIIGAMDIPNDGHVNPVHLTQAFSKSAVTLGATVKEFVEVYSFTESSGKITGVHTNIGDFYGENIVVANGAWSARLLKEANINLPTYPVKGECMSVITERPLIKSTIFSQRCYVVPKSGNRLIIGATSIPNSFSEHVSVEGISSLMQAAVEILPDIQRAQFERAWAGIRPQTIDELPFLGVHPTIENVFICTGHYRNGILLSPISGKLIVDMMDGRTLPSYLQAFTLDRLKGVITT